LVSIQRLDKGRLQVLAAPSLPTSYVETLDGVAAVPGAGSCGHAAACGELSVAEDIRLHPHWADSREAARLAGLRACWALPFKTDQNEVLGVFGIYRRKVMRPTPDDIALVVEFTRLAGLAVRQQQRDAERLQSELRFRATFEQAAVCIAHLASYGHWLRVHQRLCQMLSYSSAGLVQLTYEEITLPGAHAADL